MTNIEWTDESWNPIRARALDNGMIGWHCEHASPGCANCYAETQNMARRFDLGTDLAYKPGHRKDIEVFLDEAQLLKPLRWKKGRKVFVCSMTDLFADFVTDEVIDRIFAVMALCPQHTFQVLTKRSARMREYFRETTGWRARIAELLNELKPSPLWNGNVYQGWQNLHGRPDGLPNVWLGVSVEDQQRADERIPDLLFTPAAVRWVSCEPLLGPVDLTWISFKNERGGTENFDALDLHLFEGQTDFGDESNTAILDWVVVGGESGAKARPMHPDWARSLRDQCAAAGVPFFFKQWGEWWPNPPEARMTIQQFNRELRYIDIDTGAAKTDPTRTSDQSMRKVRKKRAGRLLDGVEHNGMPEAA